MGGLIFPIENRSGSTWRRGSSSDGDSDLMGKMSDNPIVNQISSPVGEELDPRKYFENRSKEIKDFIESGRVDPYPHKFHVSISIPEYVKKYTSLDHGVTSNKTESVSGRIMSARFSGKKLAFYDLVGGSGKVQVIAVWQQMKDSFDEITKIIHRGDIVGVIGSPSRSKSGELSITASEIKLLSPCLRMLPKIHYGYKDQELRYRYRYVDLIMNEGVRNKFLIRSKIISFIRSYLESMGFLEVETPSMNVIAGGAAAKPFITHHNDLKVDLYMRVSPELYLKELIVGGLERVFEIGKVFRNESLTPNHNPEFTSMEFYMAYADMYDLMTISEELVSGVVKHIFGTCKIPIHASGPDKEPTIVDFTPPFKRIRMIPELERVLNVKFPDPDTFQTPEGVAFLDKLCRDNRVPCSEPRTAARMLDKLVGEYIEVQCINPTFIMEHPHIMSPLAKSHRDYHGLCERFEVFVLQKEIINAYTELNNPFTQRERFEQQEKDKKAGDEEAQVIDEIFLNSLEHGLPPTGGFGLGIDRLTMLLTDSNTIKEVILFPTMKPEVVNTTEPSANI